MTDTRSKAAEEWMRSQVMRVWTDDILPEIESAHLAGHEHMAAIKDAEIAQLKERISRYERTQVDWPIVEGEYKAEIAALREALSARDIFINFVRAGEAVAVSACLWTEWEEGQWEAACGLIWELNDDCSRATPKMHGMSFCPGCGKPLTEKVYVEPPVEDDEEKP